MRVYFFSEVTLYIPAAISLILPAFYTGIAIHYGTYNAQDCKYWFVKFDSSQFHVLLIMNLLLVISYLFLTIYLLKILRNEVPVKKCQHERYVRRRNYFLYTKFWREKLICWFLFWVFWVKKKMQISFSRQNFNIGCHFFCMNVREN